jgi:hypothetical protein
MYRDAVDRYARVARLAELEVDDWAAIEIVADWLKLFRTATTFMSSSKETTLSWATTIFMGLQDHIQTQLERLPENTSPLLMKGLSDAHQKLAEYHRYSDRSPYYLWASSKSFSSSSVIYPLINAQCLTLALCSAASSAGTAHTSTF